MKNKRPVGKKDGMLSPLSLELRGAGGGCRYDVDERGGVDGSSRSGGGRMVTEA